MGDSGFVWVIVDLFGSSWICLGDSGFVWVIVDMFGSSWMFGSYWITMDLSLSHSELFLLIVAHLPILVQRLTVGHDGS